MIRRPPRSTLFPYPPLFRSKRQRGDVTDYRPDDDRVRGDKTHSVQKEATGGEGSDDLANGPTAGRIESVDRRRSGEHTSELQSPCNLVCRLLLEKKKKYHTSSADATAAHPSIKCLTRIHPSCWPTFLKLIIFSSDLLIRLY